MIFLHEHMEAHHEDHASLAHEVDLEVLDDHEYIYIIQYEKFRYKVELLSTIKNELECGLLKTF